MGGTISWVPEAPSVELPILLSHVEDEPVTVTYRTVDGTARAGEDFVGVTEGTVTIAPGSLSAPAVVRLVPGAAPEPGEYFYVELTATSSGILDNGRATVTFVVRG
jgi:hypothetical protein